MSRFVHVVVTLDLDLRVGRPVVGVAPLSSEHHPCVTADEVEQAVAVVIAELDPLLADVTGELGDSEPTDRGEGAPR